jgi:hypothetical protein
MSKLLLLAGLSFYYLYVLYLIAMPMVSAQYRAYYMDNETDISILASRALQFDPIILGQREDVTSQRIFFDGWWDPIEGERRSRRKRSRLRFDLTEEDLARAQGKITIDYVIHDKPHEVKFSFNRVPLETHELMQSGTLTLSIPKTLLAQHNSLTLDIPGAGRASWNDERIMGIGIRHVTVE